LKTGQKLRVFWLLMMQETCATNLLQESMTDVQVSCTSFLVCVRCIKFD